MTIESVSYIYNNIIGVKVLTLYNFN